MAATAVLLPTCLLWSCTFDWHVIVPPPVEGPGVITPGSIDERDEDGSVDEALVDASEGGEDASSDALGEWDGDAAKPCSVTSPCGANEVCRYPDRYCGSGMTVGSCAPRPTQCADAGIAPVCGCDHEVHASTCAAEQSGEDVSLQACPSTPPGSYRCGHRFCDDSEYCEIKGTGTAATYQCKSLGGCTLGCLCQLLSCPCTKESGHVVTRCQ